ncbi:hypothetical protein [Amnibacterium kyonggiense]|uniref:Uncharacterized protein n=1 Tax=Amnibacterium kyonggiense TaxID=595671 RepID=A0A4R7FCM2_9MICO|nr:hypothetical protein [Amnibacterium kyonggiense]TDS74511.1 hypothetical protein CLV52_3694 [Amnibacterium kyonggiense]
MHFPWYLVIIALGYGFGYGLRPLILRWNARSPEWHERSERYQRILSLLPGYLLGAAVGAVLVFTFDR